MNLKQLFSGEDNRLVGVIGNQEIDNKYTKLQPGILSKSTIRDIVASDSQLIFLKSLWHANVGRNGYTVNYDRSVSERTKEKIQKQTKQLLSSDKINFNHIKKDIINNIFDFGSAILILNNEGKVIVKSPFDFDITRDPINQINNYTLIHQGSPVPGYSDMKHGELIYHIQDPMFSHWALAPSRLNLLYIYLMLENSAVKSNIKLFQNGAINLSLLNFDLSADMAGYQAIDPSTVTPTNKKGATFLEQIMKRIRDFTAGVKNANGLQTIQGLKDVFELGKDNTQMQFMELVKELAPEKKAWAYGAVSADLGLGGATTYNNTQTFSYAMYDKVGRDLEYEIDLATSNWILPQFKLDTGFYGDYYIQHNKPTNPDWVAKRDQTRLDWVNNAITLNQYLDSTDRPPVEGGDVYKAEWEAMLGVGLTPQEQPQNLDNSKKKIHQQQEQLIAKMVKSLNKY